GNGRIERLRRQGVQAESDEQIPIDFFPVTVSGGGEHSQHQQQNQALQKVQHVPTMAVGGHVENDVLVRENNKGVEKNPPHQQHQEIQGGEVEFPVALGAMRTQRDRSHHRNNVDEENDVGKKRVGERAAEEDFEDGPRRLVNRPEKA